MGGTSEVGETSKNVIGDVGRGDVRKVFEVGLLKMWSAQY